MDKVLYNFARRGIMPLMGGSSFYRGGLTVDSVGRISANNCGRDYYVAGNFGVAGNDGSSWDKAMATLAEAVTANNANIALNSHGWAARNRMFITGDLFDENLVAFPNKCDVIGVGSYDANTKAGIQGIHAPVNAGNYGTRFINVWFKAEASAAPLITLASTSSGIQLIECTLDGSVGTVTHAVKATASPFLKIIGCDISGPFATAYIGFGTGETASTLIDDCIMSGSAGIGIVSVTGTTASYASIVRNSLIMTTSTGLCIDDEANGSTGILYCMDLRCKNEATLTNYAGRTGILDINEARALNVQYAGADVAGYIPLWTLT